ncbi:MAG: DNA topoisomerase III [Desulfotomaculaceae bacterium]|nr:DNA topoisomerase III [Desulfotomaculaceae bacterium]
MKSLVLAEKPSVAKEIARVLKCASKNKGFIEGPHYVVTWALGHLVTLAEPEDYDQKYKQWNLADLPMLPAGMKLKVIRQTSHQFRVIRNLMKRADIRDLVIATDAGREGELVARWIMAQANWKKPFKRLWISSQTDEAIGAGFANLKAGSAYNNLYEAAVCRAEADWLIGLNVTRALTCKFNAQLTAGRVQTPTLAMIVNREAEIKQFVPVDFWTIRADFGDYFGDWRGRSGKNRIFKLAQTEEILAKIQGHPGVIKDIHTEGKSEPAPLAYDLTELQRDANKRYGFSAQKTLSVLQALYEQHKLATYPRTDSRYITKDMAPTLPVRLKSVAVGPYAGLVQPLLQKTLTPTKRFVDDSKVTDHHAIIPTGQPLQQATLSADEKNLFDLIVRRFIAVLYPPYRYDQTTLTTVVNGEHFYSRGRVIKDSGWRAVTARTAVEKDDPDDVLPDQVLAMQKKGEQKRVQNCKIKKSKTKPPARYTEATLLTAMESPGKFIEDEELREAMKGSGLGTPATRADIIEKLLYNNYVERQGKEMAPTSKGMQLINLVAPALKTPELTAQWEQRLDNIAEGRDNKADFLAGIRQNTLELVQSVIADNAVYKADNVSKTKCPLCGKLMLLVKGKRGRMLVCPDRSCGHRQPEKQDDFIFKSSRSASTVNQKLISRYSDQGSIGQNLGELLKVALTKNDNIKQPKK